MDQAPLLLPQVKVHSKSAPLPAELRLALAKMVDAHGSRAAARLVGLSPLAFARALAGLGVYRGTVALVRAALVTEAAASSPSP